MRGTRTLRRQSDNLYERVRALFFLYAIHRFHLPRKAGHREPGPRSPSPLIRISCSAASKRPSPSASHQQKADGPSDALSSALAAAYRGLAFQTLADQVRRSVRSVRGNQWMFRTGHPADYPLRIRPELLDGRSRPFPVLHEATPVRMDLTHSGWSDIFFLGMDYPEGARVLNVSIDLAPCAAPRRRPRSRRSNATCGSSTGLFSALSASTSKPPPRLGEIHEVFDFARDYLGLLKAGVIAAGLIPPGMEGSTQPLADLLESSPAGRATASNWSRASTTFPRGLGSRSRPICSPV